MKRLAERIKTNGCAIGTVVTVPSPALAEALSGSGLDWLFFDLEHSVMSIADVQGMIQAMDRDCLPFVRVEEPHPHFITKALDTGCDGIIVPQVNSVALAKEVISAGRYPPAGMRSVGLSRALNYGTGLAEGVKTENDRISVILQIEHIDAVKAVNEIAALPGVDGLFVGPYDLSSSMGIPGQITDPRVQESIALTVKAAKQNKLLLGIFSRTEENAQKAIQQGFEFVAVRADIGRMIDSCADTVSKLRGK